MKKETTTRGWKLDRSKIAAGQDYEVNYEKKKLNTSTNEIKDAVKSVGNLRNKVEGRLTK